MESEESERPTFHALGGALSLIDQLEQNLSLLRQNGPSSSRDQLVDELKEALGTIRNELTQARPD